MTKAPERAHVLICKIGADTKDALVQAIEQFASRVARNDISHGCYGGPDDGAEYCYRHDPNQTHETYFEHLQRYLDEERERND